MKIAVTSEDGEVFQHFGHTPGFTLFETDGKNILSETELSSGETGHGALAGLLAEKDVDLLICGGIGGGAVQALASAGIRVIGGASGKVRDVVRGLLDGTLQVRSDFHCHHHDSGEHHCGSHGCGSHSCGH